MEYMVLKTCLLVTDDPDNHLEFSEALYEISKDTILLSVSNANKAMALLTAKAHIPDYVILDLAMFDINAELFLAVINSAREIKSITLAAYGDYADINRIQGQGISSFLSNDFTYSAMRNFLLKTINP